MHEHQVALMQFYALAVGGDGCPSGTDEVQFMAADAVGEGT